jgi:uncharacterized delta-60 repeat protein
MKHLISIKLILILSAINLFSQTVYQQWVDRYNGSANLYDGTTCIATDAQGYIYVAGSSYSINTNRDCVTIKYNQNGETMWVRKFSGALAFGGDYLFAITVDNSGNVYVTGRCDNGAPTYSDYVTIKYNSSGVQQWASCYNGPANSTDEARAIAVDNSGNVYVTGKSPGLGGQSGYGYDIATVKYDVNGNQMWVARYNGTANGDDFGAAIGVDANGNVYVSGSTLGNDPPASYAILIKYNSDGVQQWIQRNNGPGNTGGGSNSLRIDGSGFIYIGGYSWNPTSNYDYLTMKYNSDGVLQWYQRYDGGFGLGDFETAMKLDLAGNVYVTGKSTGQIHLADSIFVTIKYNTDGIQQWVQLYPGTFNSVNVAHDLAVDNSGNVYVTGSSMYNGMNHFITIGYNANGNEQWNMVYVGPGAGNDFSNAIAIDNYKNVYVTGASFGNGTDYDVATIKYTSLVGIKHSGNEIPSKYELRQNFPNPFNPSTTISFDIPFSGNAKLTIFDINGKEVDVLVNDYLNPNKYEITWNAANYSSGVYFYKLEINGYSSIKKMMIIK